jgi:hypothetical protein
VIGVVGVVGVVGKFPSPGDATSAEPQAASAITAVPAIRTLVSRSIGDPLALNLRITTRPNDAAQQSRRWLYGGFAMVE